jgi:hypothetical protein
MRSRNVTFAVVVLTVLPITVLGADAPPAHPAQGGQSLCDPHTFMPSNPKIRPYVKRFIERLGDYRLESPTHTTDGLSETSVKRQRRVPGDPRPFPAGRYKVVFEGDQDRGALWIDTEVLVGHFSTVTPGVTDTGGYVQISDDPDVERPAGPRLTDEELEYLIARLYSRFCREVDIDTGTRLDEVKDRLLAVRFGRRSGLQEFHGELLRRLK